MEVLKLMMNHSDLLSRPYSPDLRVPAINLENFPQFLICKKILCFLFKAKKKIILRRLYRAFDESFVINGHKYER